MTAPVGSGQGIRPRWRGREARLLLLVAARPGIGWLGLASTAAGRPTLGDPLGPCSSCWSCSWLVHLVLTADGRRRDQVLLPVVGLLMGLSLLLMSRLPQDLVVQRLGACRALARLATAALDRPLAGHRGGHRRRTAQRPGSCGATSTPGPSPASLLLLLVFVFGDETNGARLTLRIGPFAGQPSELLKIILVVFLAAYLADNRALLAGRDSRLGPIRLPPLLYLLPMLVIWGLALATVVVQRDLGAALLFYGVFLLLLYVATQRRDLLALGVVLFVVGGDRPLRPLPARPGAGPDLARPVRHRPGRRLPDRPRPVRLRPRRRSRAPGSAPACRASGARRRSRPSTRTSSSPPWARSSAWPAASPSWPLRRLRGAWPAHRGGGARRVPDAARRGPDPGHRRPGGDHRGRQRQAHPVDRHHPALDRLRRLVDARRRHRPGAAAVDRGRGSARVPCANGSAGGSGSATPRGQRPVASNGWCDESPSASPDHGRSRGRPRRPVRWPAGRWRRRSCGSASGSSSSTPPSASASAGGASSRPARLTADPGNPLVLAAREAPRGEILDARGVVLAESVKDGQGGYVRHYPHPEAEPLIGYLSPRFGASGLERSYGPELLGLGDSGRRAAAQAPPRPVRRAGPAPVARSAAPAARPPPAARRARRHRRHRAVDRSHPGPGQHADVRPQRHRRPEDGRRLLPVAPRPAGGGLGAARSRHAGRLHAGVGAQDGDRRGRPRE